MKLHSPDITHKTDAGGVRLDLRSDADVCEAYRRIISSACSYKPDARIEGVTIQPYYSNPDFEILLGAKRDPSFGPVILFGMGGIYTEVLKDRGTGTSAHEPVTRPSTHAGNQGLLPVARIPKPACRRYGAARRNDYPALPTPDRFP